MTANLTPQYHDAEERFKGAPAHAEKLAALREMIALLPKHKGTEKMLADLRKRLSKLEDEAAHPPRLPNLAHEADGVLLVVDVGADDTGPSAKLLHDLLARARVWPRSRPLPEGAPPFLQPKPVLVLGNKSEDDDGTFAALAKEAIGPAPPFFPVSAVSGAGLEALREVLFRELKRIRVYPKEPGKKPDFERPFVLPQGAREGRSSLRQPSRSNLSRRMSSRFLRPSNTPRTTTRTLSTR